MEGSSAAIAGLGIIACGFSRMIMLTDQCYAMRYGARISRVNLGNAYS